ARSPAGGWRARLFPAPLRRLRPRGRRMRASALRRAGFAHRAERPLDVLLRGLPEIARPAVSLYAGGIKGSPRHDQTRAARQFGRGNDRAAGGGITEMAVRKRLDSPQVQDE